MTIFSDLIFLFRYFCSVHTVNLFFYVIGLVDYCFGTFLSESHACIPHQHTPRISHHLFSLSLFLSLYFPLLSVSKPRPYRHRLKRIRHGSGAVKKPIHVSTASAAKSSKSRCRFRRIRMKRSRRGGWLRPVAMQAVEVHRATRHAAERDAQRSSDSSTERLQSGQISRTSGVASLTSIFSVIISGDEEEEHVMKDLKIR